MTVQPEHRPTAEPDGECEPPVQGECGSAAELEGECEPHVQGECGSAAEPEREPAVQPEDLGRFFLDRANAGDVEGLVALYEPGAVLAFPPGKLAAGHEQIRAVYAELLADRPSFSSAGQPSAIINGDLALTSTRLPGGGATVEVARRQPDGTWRWDRSACAAGGIRPSLIRLGPSRPGKRQQVGFDPAAAGRLGRQR